MMVIDPDPNTSHHRKVYGDIHAERVRAHEKHKAKPGGSMEMKGWQSNDWLPVLMEEVGEVANVICDTRHELILGEYRWTRLRDELVQVAAMAAAWIAAIDSMDD